jgi:hypothetical protein
MMTMVLHNYIREHTSGDIDFERLECDEDYEITIPERYTKYVVSSDSFTPLSKVTTMDNFHDESATDISLGWN